MPVHDVDEIERLKKINAALIGRVERSMDQQGNAFSLFQTAINLENRIKSRTEELNATLRRLEQTNIDLVAAKESAEQANISKTRFLAAASHDVLQPLNAAHLSVSALADLQTTKEGTLLVRQVERSLDTMSELLRTLLDISKLDAGVVKPEPVEVSLEQMFQSLRSDFQPIADKKGLRLRFRPTQFSLISDRTLLRRVPAEHHLERHSLHTTWRRAGFGAPAAGCCPHRSLGHRQRHPRRPDGEGLRGVPPRRGGKRTGAVRRRLGPRPGDRATNGRHAGL